MFGTLQSAPGQAAACAQVAAWVRERFRLAPDVAVLVTEVMCGLPGCPPLETVVAFWTAAERRHNLKVFKPVLEVCADDLPPWWMKDALIVPPGFEADCC